MNAIEVNSLSKKFIERGWFMNKIREVHALDQVSLTIEKGRLFGLLGPNGAGKTTLMKIICTLILPDSGEATVNGYDIIKQDDNVRGSIGFVTGEERSFFWRLTGKQNLEFFAALQNLSSEAVNKRISEVVYILGLENDIDKPYRTYSTGMKHKLDIARSLLHNPPILIMDEPTRGLDPLASKKLRQFIKKDLVITHGRTVVISTHLLSEAEEICDTVAIMNKGKIKSIGSIKDINNRYGSLMNAFEKMVEGID